MLDRNTSLIEADRFSNLNIVRTANRVTEALAKQMRQVTVAVANTPSLALALVPILQTIEEKSPNIFLEQYPETDYANCTRYTKFMEAPLYKELSRLIEEKKMDRPAFEAFCKALQGHDATKDYATLFLPAFAHATGKVEKVHQQLRDEFKAYLDHAEKVTRGEDYRHSGVVAAWAEMVKYFPAYLEDFLQTLASMNNPSDAGCNWDEIPSPLSAAANDGYGRLANMPTLLSDEGRAKKIFEALKAANDKFKQEQNGELWYILYRALVSLARNVPELKSAIVKHIERDELLDAFQHLALAEIYANADDKENAIIHLLAVHELTEHRLTNDDYENDAHIAFLKAPEMLKKMAEKSSWTAIKDLLLQKLELHDIACVHAGLAYLNCAVRECSECATKEVVDSLLNTFEKLKQSMSPQVTNEDHPKSSFRADNFFLIYSTLIVLGEQNPTLIPSLISSGTLSEIHECFEELYQECIEDGKLPIFSDSSILVEKYPSIKQDYTPEAATEDLSKKLKNS